MESAIGRAEPSSPLSEADEGNHQHPAGADVSHAETSRNHPHLPNGNSHVTDAPPYWSDGSRHVRSISYHSISHQRPNPILLEDHSEEHNEQAQSCWANSATIDEYVLVSGPSGIGAYVVWHCTVKTLKGGDMTIRKRYACSDSRTARCTSNPVTDTPNSISFAKISSALSHMQTP